MVAAITDTPDIIKEDDLNSHSLVLVKHSAVKSASKLFGVSNRSIRRKTREEKYKRYMIRTKLDEMSWVETDNKINGREITK